MVRNRADPGRRRRLGSAPSRTGSSPQVRRRHHGKLAKGTTARANQQGRHRYRLADGAGLGELRRRERSWGTTWTLEEISRLVRRIAVQADGANTDVGLDYIRRTVTYTVAATITPAGGTTPTGTLRLAVAKPLSGGITPSGALALAKVFTLAVAGAITPTGTLRRATTKRWLAPSRRAVPRGRT